MGSSGSFLKGPGWKGKEVGRGMLDSQELGGRPNPITRKKVSTTGKQKEALSS